MIQWTKNKQRQKYIKHIYCLLRDIFPEKDSCYCIFLAQLYQRIKSTKVTIPAYIPWWHLSACVLFMVLNLFMFPSFLTGTSWESPGRFVCEQMQQEQNGHQDVSGLEGLGRTGGAPCSCCQESLGPPIQTHAERGSGEERCRILGVPYMHCGNQQPGWQSESWTLAPVSAPEESIAWLQKLLPD